MKTCLTYFWNHDQETVDQADVPFDGGRFEIPNQVLYRFCVDASETLNNPDHRYGMWSTDDDGETHWTSIPKECFPKKFLVTLLLLGVS